MSIFDFALQNFTHDIGIDLGTSGIKVALKGEGMVFNEPSVVAVNNKNKKVLAVGHEARRMIGRTPAGVSAVRPLKDGVISDFDSTEAMMRYFINKVYAKYPRKFSIQRPRVIVGIPSTVTEVECRAVIDAAKSAGARKVYIIEEPMAAAIGAGLPIEDATGSMIVDIGGGTTDIAVLSLGGIVVDNTIKIAGDEMDIEIMNYAKNKYNLLIGEKMAEDLKMSIGTAYKRRQEQEMQLKGRDIMTGLPKTITISSIEVREALQKVLTKIADATKIAIEKTPPEILSDLLDRGVILAGGGVMLPGIDKFFSERLKLPVKVAHDPQNTVARGTEILLDSIELLDKVQLTLDDLI